MQQSKSPSANALVAEDNGSEFLSDVLSGLAKARKELHCKYFYDERGSQLFDRICDLDEYYLTRTEAQVMLDNADAICQRLGPEAVLVEYGSGSSTKTRLLLDHLQDQQAYVPIDISDEHLCQTAEKLKIDYPDLDIHPIVADFTAGFELPEQYRNSEVTVYFPGSTIGNFEPGPAVELLAKIAKQCNSHGGLLVGFDLDKDEKTLLAAYDDSEGVTAEFNLNVLHRINRELEGDFDVDQFKHVAIYNAEQFRIEIYIESLVEQRVRVGDSVFQFARGERIFTEYSHKYSVERFAAMAKSAGLIMDEVWTDANNMFAVMHLSAI